MSEASRSTRVSALEDKKRRLEELKARRARRETLPEDTPKASANLNEYIDDLLKQSAPGVSTSTVFAQESVQIEPTSQSMEMQKEKQQQSKSVLDTALSEAMESTKAQVQSATLHKPQLDTFDFGTQTLEEDFPMEIEEDEIPGATEQAKTEGDDNLPELTEEKPMELEPKILTNEEKEETVVKVSFSTFLNTASKKVERLLGEPVLADLLVNYVGETDGVEISEKRSDGSKYVSASQIFEHPKWTAGRMVTDLDWSPHHRELFLSSHDMSTTTTHGVSSGLLTAISPDIPPSSSLAPRSGELESDGLCLAWNLSMPSRPEHILTCGSPVTSAKFHPMESPLVIGGCQSGQLVIWDIRAGRLPVQRSGQGYPINAIQVVENGSGLVTTSSDGKLSRWSLANLRDPAEVVKLDGNLSCLTVAPNNTFYCGDESGIIFHVPLKRKHVKKIEGHFGLVTALSIKKKMLLSAGVDWTIRLSKNDKPLWRMVSHSYDYMCDVQWNPVHPSLFATASSNGTVGLWNLADSIEVPCGEVLIEPNTGVNKILWSSDGRRILVASGERVHVLSLVDEVLRQKGDEEDRMLNLLI